MRILTSGNVGIGVSNPSVTLHVQHNQAVHFGSRVKNLSTTQFAGSGVDCSGTGGGAAFYYYNTNVGGTLDAAAIAELTRQAFIKGRSADYDFNSQYHRFATSNVERMRIDSTGNVGIGLSAPSGTLHTLGSTALFMDRAGSAHLLAAKLKRHNGIADRSGQRERNWSREFSGL
jgi:hypothetical protein